MRSLYRIIAAFAIILLISVFPAGAVAAMETTTTTTTAAAPAGPSISSFYALGSNNKYYLCSPEISQGVNKYSFSVPDWMEKITIVIKSASGLTVTCDGETVKESKGVYNCEVELTGESQTFAILMKSTGGERALSVTVNRSKIACSIESVVLRKGDQTVAEKSGSVADGLNYEFASGTTTGISIRVVPRHEDKVYLINLTGIKEDKWDEVPESDKTLLSLHEQYKRYDYDLPLEEGTNHLRIEVTAGEVTRTCDINVIVGDPMANATTATDANTTSSTDATTAPVPLTTTASKTGGTGGLPAVIWVLIGVFGTVIIGAIIYAIANAGGSRRRDDRDYDGYDYTQPPLRSPRRNLSDYIDDDYYEDGGQPMYRSNQGYNGDYSDNYSDGYDGNYGSRGGYDDYNNGGRRSRQSYRDYDDYDNFNDGGGNGYR